ncbi:hypothetical protein BGZ95_006332 [Linnemannia exigua]|uniref:Uncharacterized protein n=1 Tax=Linnemannia exigua TaxID=604196 RepID=A0AAD4H8P9_9FUNG|nr:hypothetical protein BGZ95_006332 [Linnemannia exigua]
MATPTTTSTTPRAKAVGDAPWLQTERGLVLLKDELVTEFQTFPPSGAPICFRQAVTELGSQVLGYCEKNVPSEVYHSFRDVIADHYWKTPDTWQRYIRIMQDQNTITAA